MEEKGNDVAKEALQRVVDRADSPSNRGIELGRAPSTGGRIKWEDCSIEQKIERVRQEIVALRREISGVAQVAGIATRVMHEHQHDTFGRVLVPVYQGAGMSIDSQIRGFDPLA